MTESEINIAIAESLGWEQMRETGIWHHPDGRNAIPRAGKVHARREEMRIPSEHFFLPGFCNDLNAMRHAEAGLQGEQPFHYLNELKNVLKRATNYDEIQEGDPISRYGTMWLYVHAAAPHRAEAFVRTKNLWKP